MVTRMGLRGTSAACLLLLVLAPVFSQPPPASQAPTSHWTATLQVLVRDGEGRPLSNLGADDFTLTESALRDTVLKVRSFSEPQSAPSQTSVLLVLAPASASGRNSAVNGLLKFLDSPIPAGWTLGLIDDTGKFTSFSHDSAALRTRLHYLASHVSPPQFFGGSWSTEASRAIQELAIRIGRHAIIFASDFEANVAYADARDRRLVRYGPCDFISDAIRAQAAMYTVESSGPRVTVPFGGAAEFQTQYAGSGQDVADAMMFDMVSAFQTRGDFLSGARETGGLAAADIQEALSDVAADAAGYYQITFVPNLKETDGAWHPISVTVPGRNVRLRGPSYYLAPISENQQRITAAMRAALESKSAPRLDSAAHVWLFPDSGGVHTAVMAADFVWPANSAAPTSDRKLQIYAQIVNQSMGQVVGAWLNEQPWKQDARQTLAVHWQRETPLYPGLYQLRVMALDAETGAFGTREFPFAVYPSAVTNFHVSEIIMADRCSAVDEVQGRTNLLDPLLLNSCLLAPSASASFSTSQTPTLLLRLYSTNQKLREVIQKQWKAYILLNDGPRTPVNITTGDVRGLVISQPLELKNLNPGPNTLQVVLEAKAGDGSKHTIAIRSQLTVTP
jgi:VWFA-related protein